jgi:hypothetical protein
LLSSNKAYLEEVVRSNKEFAETLKAATGDQALEMNYQDIWQTYCKQSETDLASRVAYDEYWQSIYDDEAEAYKFRMSSKNPNARRLSSDPEYISTPEPSVSLTSDQPAHCYFTPTSWPGLLSWTKSDSI